MARPGNQKPGSDESVSKVWVQATITEHLEAHGAALDEKINRFAAATAFQNLMEAAADHLGAIASPLSNLGPKRAPLDAQQTARLERIAYELARPPEQKPYLDSPDTSFGRAR